MIHQKNKVGILFLIPTMGAGGAETQVRYLLSHLDRDRFRISLCLFFNPAGGLSELPEDVEVVFLKNYKNLFSSVKQISSFIKNNQIDILNSFLPTANLFVFFLKFFLGLDINFITSQRGVRYKYLDKWTIFEKLGHSFSDIIVANSETVKENAVNFLKIKSDKVRVIRNGIPSNYFYLVPGTQKQTIVNNRNNFPVLLSIGRFDHLKGHEILVKAIEILKKRNVEVYLVLLGDGELKGKISEYIERNGLNQNVELFPVTDGVKGFFEACDIFVLATFSEGLSNVIMEASASSLPVVTTDIPANRELITEDVSGSLVPPGKPEILADKIEELTKTPDKGKEMGKRGRELIKENFSIEKMVKLYETLYKDIVDKR